MSIGLKRGTVYLAESTDEWVRAYEIERKDLIKALGILPTDIEHIGSTSIQGVPAKPLIDIIVAIDSLQAVQKYRPALETMGYEYMPERVFDDRVFFPKGPQENRTHHLSFVVRGSDGWQGPILFRDYLNSHADDRKRYADLKITLARQHPDDREKYTAGKVEFIQDIITKAKE